MQLRSPGGLVGVLSRSWLLVVPTIVVVALAAWLPGFADMGPVDRDEARFAQASKQMLEDGDFIVSRVGDEPRYKKPIGVYWLQAASATIFAHGAASSIWAFRLPSLLAGLVSALLTAVIGAAMFGRFVGLLAGLALATTLVMTVEARLAKTDAVLLATVLIMQFGLWKIWARRADPAEDQPWWAVFWLGIGLSLLVKGPVGPALGVLTVAGLVVAARSGTWLHRLRPLRGLALTILIAAPWLVAVLIATDGAFIAALNADGLGKVFAVQEGHGGLPGFYLLGAWATAWPFVALVPLAVVWAWRHRGDDRVAFLMAWVAGFWLLFEAMATKLPHYVLPTYPALAIAVAAAVSSLDRRRPWLVGLPLAVVLAVGAVLAGSSIVLPLVLQDALPPVVVGGALVSVVLLVLVWRAYVRGRAQIAGAWMLAAALILYATFYGGIFPRMEALHLSERMADAARAFAPCSTPTVATTGYHEPSTLFLIGTGTLLLDPQEAAALLAREPCALVFVDERRRAAFEAALDVPARRLKTIGGYRINGGRFSEITLFGRAP